MFVYIYIYAYLYIHIMNLYLVQTSESPFLLLVATCVSGPSTCGWRVHGSPCRPGEARVVLAKHLAWLPYASSIWWSPAFIANHSIWHLSSTRPRNLYQGFLQLAQYKLPLFWKTQMQFWVMIQTYGLQKFGSSWSSGDEGNALGGSYMVFHWQCDLAPFLSDSGSSRYLFTTVPSTAYVYDRDINITLQAAAQHICRSLMDLRISIPMTGIDTWHVLFFFNFAHPYFAGNQPPVQWLHAPHGCLQGFIYGCVCDGIQGWLEVPVPIVQPGSHSDFRTGPVIQWRWIISGISTKYNRIYMDFTYSENNFVKCPWTTWEV